MAVTKEAGVYDLYQTATELVAQIRLTEAQFPGFAHIIEDTLNPFSESDAFLDISRPSLTIKLPGTYCLVFSFTNSISGQNRVHGVLTAPTRRMLLRRVPFWSRLVLPHGSAYPNSALNYTSIRSITVWEPDRKSGYRTVRQATATWRDVYSIDNVKSTIKNLKKQFRLWRREWKEWWVNAQETLEPGDVKMVFDFRDPDREKLEGWVVTADADYLHGRSWGKMELTQQETCLFTGSLDHTPIPDGWSVRAGYVNLRSPYKLKSFHREDAYNWMLFTHLIIRCRGDGRNYMINLNTRGFFDVSWNDLYSYPLYTRGGPYWQTERIPFSKFFFAHKGKIQDKQTQIDLMNVHSVSFTAGDGIDGPFSLEIDYIAIEMDVNHKEEFAYELYEGRRFET